MLKSPTIQGTVKEGLQKDITHSNIHFKVGFTGKDGYRRVYNWESLIDRYRDILLAYMVYVELSPKEMVTYRFNPRGYCYDFYTSPDLWSILLRLNNMTTSMDFTKRKFLTFGPKFNEAINEIMMIEDDNLVMSRVEAKTGE